MPVIAALSVSTTLLLVALLVRDRQFKRADRSRIYWQNQAAKPFLASKLEDRECTWCGDIADRSYGKRSFGAAVRDHIEHYRQRAYTAESKLVWASRREKQLRAELADRPHAEAA